MVPPPNDFNVITVFRIIYSPVLLLAELPEMLSFVATLQERFFFAFEDPSGGVFRHSFDDNILFLGL
jgi:hypothetical protein